MKRPMTVVNFLNDTSNLTAYPVYMLTFDKNIVKIEASKLWEMVSLNGELTDDFELISPHIEETLFFIVFETEIVYLIRRNKEVLAENKRLHDSLEFYRDSYSEQKESLSNMFIHAFMPRGYSKASYTEEYNSTPLRRHIANVLFLLEARGYKLPKDVVDFKKRYATKKTTRR